MKITKLKHVEKFDTPEGLMSPMIFGDNISVFHLEIEPGLEVPPHGHPGEGILYCLRGTMEITGRESRTLEKDTLLYLSPEEPAGIKNSTGKTARALLISSPPSASSVEEFKKLLKEFS
jgi:quercetin dioxygenase-like cupin family protein